MMKKLVVISLSALMLGACSEQEHYQQVVLDQVSHDVDIQSYHLDPERVTQCIVDLTSKKMDGFVPFDPKRKAAYLAYADMIALKTSTNPNEVLGRLKDAFGSAKGLADAHRYYAESYLECISSITNRDLDSEADDV